MTSVLEPNYIAFPSDFPYYLVADYIFAQYVVHQLADVGNQ